MSAHMPAARDRRIRERREAALADTARALRECFPDRWEEILRDILLPMHALDPNYWTHYGSLGGESVIGGSVDLIDPRWFPLISVRGRFPDRFDLDRLQISGPGTPLPPMVTLKISRNGQQLARFQANEFTFGALLQLRLETTEYWSFLLSCLDPIDRISFAFSGWHQ